MPNRESQAWNQDESSIKATGRVCNKDRVDWGMIQGFVRRSQALISIQNRDTPGRKSIKIMVLGQSRKLFIFVLFACFIDSTLRCASEVLQVVSTCLYPVLIQPIDPTDNIPYRTGLSYGFVWKWCAPNSWKDCHFGGYITGLQTPLNITWLLIYSIDIPLYPRSRLLIQYEWGYKQLVMWLWTNGNLVV